MAGFEARGVRRHRLRLRSHCGHRPLPTAILSSLANGHRTRDESIFACRLVAAAGQPSDVAGVRAWMAVETVSMDPLSLAGLSLRSSPALRASGLSGRTH